MGPDTRYMSFCIRADKQVGEVASQNIQKLTPTLFEVVLRVSFRNTLRENSKALASVDVGEINGWL